MVVQKDGLENLIRGEYQPKSIDLLQALFTPWLVGHSYNKFTVPSTGNIYFTAQVQRIPAEQAALAYFKETSEGVPGDIHIGLPQEMLERELSNVTLGGSVTLSLDGRFYRTTLTESKKSPVQLIATFGQEWAGQTGTCWGVYGYIVKDHLPVKEV